MGSWHHLLRGGAPSLFDLHGAFLRMCSWRGLLDFKNEEYVVSYLPSGQGPASSIILLLWSFCYYGVSVHRRETVQPGTHLSPTLVPGSRTGHIFLGDTIQTTTIPRPSDLLSITACFPELWKLKCSPFQYPTTALV